MATPLPDDVRAALAAGNQLEAIRLLRRHTGLGLAEAKAVVDAARVPRVERSPEGVAGLPADAKAALARGDVLQALRLLRSAKGIGLKEAKALIDGARGPTSRVDRMPARHADGRSRSGLAPGEVPRSPIGAGTVIVLLLVAALVLWLARGG